MFAYDIGILKSEDRLQQALDRVDALPTNSRPSPRRTPTSWCA